MLKEYFAALWADWVARMSGIASVILAFLAAYLEFIVKHGKAVLWVTAALCLIIASYRIWAKEHKAVLAAQAQLGKEGKAALDRNYIIERLKGYIQEDLQNQSWGGLSSRKPENWGKIINMNSYSERVREFLRINLGESYVARYKEKRTQALEEIVRELLDS